MAAKASREEVIAFRLHAHHLTERLDERRLLDAAGGCGVQDSPPGSALLALNARVENVTRERVDDAIAVGRSLLRSWCMRGAPFCFPTADAPVFTAGALPPTEAGMRQLVLGVGPAVDELGLSLTEAVDLTGAEVGDVLAGRRLPVGPLGEELAARIAGRLSRRQRGIWEREGPYAAGQPLGEAVAHFCLRILALRGVVCFAPREGGKAPFVLVEEWLGEPIPDPGPEAARAELLRRYLRCYGPSTRAEFAAWLGVRTGDVDPWWDPVEDELAPVEHGRRTWILAADLDALRSPPAPRGIRLLPPRDPYTGSRDRETIVEKKHHRDVWRPTGDPGTILADGEIVGIWRPRKKGRELRIEAKAFDPLPARAREPLEAEAGRVAALRGASSFALELDAL